MRQRIDVHESKDRYDRAEQHVKVDKQLSNANRENILRFVSDLQAEGIGQLRVIKYLCILPKLSKLLKKDFQKATINDIKRLVNEINQLPLSDWTKSDCRVTLKRFYRWLRKLPPGENAPETAWIRIGNGNKRVLPEELLTEDEIQKLLDQCANSRDRAFVLCTYETGGRIGELLSMRIKHVQFDSLGAHLMFSGKTGDRRVRVIPSAPALSQWLLDHPGRENPDSPLWIAIGDRNSGDPLLYFAARALLRRLAKRAGIKKKVNPHAFRHSRASFLANGRLNERQMEQYLGWTTGSKMPKIYVHLSGRDTDTAILRLNGLEEEPQKKRPQLTTVVCPRCQLKNESTLKFCGKCGLPLRLEVAMEVEDQRKQADDYMNRLLEDPEVRQLIQAKLRNWALQEAMKQVKAVQP
ncbi:MAG: site-specific integrase [Candidatus Bathyarchaeia archaeon]